MAELPPEGVQVVRKMVLSLDLLVEAVLVFLPVLHTGDPSSSVKMWFENCRYNRSTSARTDSGSYSSR